MDWQLADAKNRFSKVVTMAITDGPQRVRRRDQSVFVISESDYLKLTGEKVGFKDYLLSGPSFDELSLDRDSSPGRDVNI